MTQMRWMKVYRVIQLQSRMQKIQTMIQRLCLTRKLQFHCTVLTHRLANARYIRDLIKYLQADNYTKVNVGLKVAPNLIRRKATFGTEQSDHAHDLARILVGMQDIYEMDEFQEMRQAALIALVASAPEIVVSYLIDVFFTGDLSIQH